MSMNRHASGIHVAGHDPLVAGVNRKWFGSILHPRKSNINQLHLPWLPDQQQKRHLSWQSAEQDDDNELRLEAERARREP